MPVNLVLAKSYNSLLLVKKSFINYIQTSPYVSLSHSLLHSRNSSHGICFGIQTSSVLATFPSYSWTIQDHSQKVNNKDQIQQCFSSTANYNCSHLRTSKWRCPAKSHLSESTTLVMQWLPFHDKSAGNDEAVYTKNGSNIEWYSHLLNHSAWMKGESS